LLKEIRFGIVDPISKSKPPFLQWIGGQWRLWLAYNPTLTEGTFLILNDNGTITRRTILPDGTMKEGIT